MARIRTVKPEFWTDEKVVELSFPARLLFIGLLNFADDEGRMVYSPKRIKMQIFPADSMDVGKHLTELVEQKIIHVYRVDEQEFLQIVNFSLHQKIDKRSASKIPPPNGLDQLKRFNNKRTGFVYAVKQRDGTLVKIGKATNADARTNAIANSAPFPTDMIGSVETEDMSLLEVAIHKHFKHRRTNGEWFDMTLEDIEIVKNFLKSSDSARRILSEYSTNTRGVPPTDQGREGKGRDQGGDQGREGIKEVLQGNISPEMSPPASASESKKQNSVPYETIVELYHELLPELPKVAKLTNQRRGYIRQRWLEDLPDMEAWREYFVIVRKSKFLMGKSNGSKGRPPFRADLTWLCRPENIVKVIEGKYHG